MQAAPSIRAANVSDLPEIEALMTECMCHYYGKPDGAKESALHMVSGKAGAIETIVANLAGEALAFATFAIVYPGPEGRGTLFLKDLFVSGKARSQNVGLSMMRYLSGIARDRNCIRFDWTAETYNAGALSFYDRLGASRIEEKVYFRLEGEQLEQLAVAPAQTEGNLK